LFLATFLFVVPLTSPWWSTVLRGELPDAAEDETDGSKVVGTAPPTDLPEVPGSTLKISLFTRMPDKSGLVMVEREIPYSRGIVPQVRAAVSELALPTTDTPALLPVGTKVLDVAYTQQGTIYIDFSAELETARGVGAEEEKLLIQGIVTTIAENFAAVRRVVILVDGKAPKPGHLDLSRPLRRDDPVFAAEPEPSPDPLASPATPSVLAAPPIPTPSVIGSPLPSSVSKAPNAVAPASPKPSP
jgi:hypothetical protein